MKITKMLFAVLFLAIIATIIAGCGSDSNNNNTPGVLTVTTAALPGVTVNTAYNQTLAASGGTAPYTWSVSVGTLPAGLSLNASTGAITGTPTTAATANFTVMVTDSATPAGTATKALSIAVTAPGAALAVTTASPLPGATVGTAYSQTLAASGGTSPYTWALAAGSAALPAWLTLSPAGTLSGTPPTGAVTANFTVMVTDSATPAGTATKAFSMPVGSTPPVFNALIFYDTSCINTGAGCHTTLGVRSAGQITTAIANFNAMSRFRSTGSNPLTAAQITAIAAVSH